MASRTISSSAIATVPTRGFRLLVDGIRAWVRSISSGSTSGPCVGILEGGPGQGSGTLLRLLEGTSKDLGIQFLGTSFAPSTTSGVEPLVDLVEPFVMDALDGSRQGDASREGFLERFGPDLVHLLPELEWPDSTVPAVTEGVDDDRSRRMDALVQTILESTCGKPTVLALHGVDGGDALSRDAILHLLRVLRRRRGRGRRHHVLVIAGTGCGSTSSFLELADTRSIAFRIRVRGYSRDDLEELARVELVERMSVSIREKVFRSSGGDTRYVRWLFSRLREEGLTASWLLETYPSFEELARDDLHRLEPVLRQIVSLLSVCGFPADEPLLREWVDEHGLVVDEVETGEQLDELLAELEDRGWVCSSGVGPARRWYMEPDVARVALGCLDPARARSLAEQLAAWLVDRCGGVGRRTVRAFRILSLAGGVPTDGANGSLPGIDDLDFSRMQPCRESLGEAAAGYLEKLGAPSAALEVLEDTLGSLNESVDRVGEDLEERVVRLLCETGNHREAIDLLEARLGNTTSAADRVSVVRRVSGLRGRLGDRAARLAGLQDALGFLQVDPDEIERGRVLEDLAVHWLEDDEFDRADDAGREALAVLEARDSCDESERRRVWRLLETIASRRGDRHAAQELEQRIYEAAVVANDVVAQVRSLLGLSSFFCTEDHHARSDACLREALRLAQESGARRIEAEVLRRLGQTNGDCRGDDEAFRYLERAWSILDEFGDEAGLAQVEVHLVECELRTGRFRHAARTLRSCVERRFSCSCSWPLRADGAADGASTADVQRGRAEERCRERTLETRWQDGSALLGPDDLLELVALRRKSGELTGAFRLLESALGRDEFRSGVETRARAVQELGRLSLLRGEVDLALKSFEQSLKTHAGVPSRERVASAYLEVGGVLLLGGHIARALDYTLRGLRIAWDESDDAGVAESLLRLAEFLVEAGQYHAATIVCTSAANLARHLGLWAAELSASTIAVRATRGAGEDKATRRALRRAWELDRVLDQPLDRLRLCLEAGWERYGQGDFQLAGEHGRRGADIAKKIGAQSMLPDFRLLLAAIDGCPSNPHNNFIRALQVLESVQQDAEVLGRPRLGWEVCLVMEEVYASRGKTEISDGLRRRADAASTLCHSALPRELRVLCWSSRHRSSRHPS